jgi:hypothetical protein
MQSVKPVLCPSCAVEFAKDACVCPQCGRNLESTGNPNRYQVVRDGNAFGIMLQDNMLLGKMGLQEAQETLARWEHSGGSTIPLRKRVARVLGILLPILFGGMLGALIVYCPTAYILCSDKYPESNLCGLPAFFLAALIFPIGGIAGFLLARPWLKQNKDELYLASRMKKS